MNGQDFDKHVEDWLNTIRTTLMVKGGEYSGKEDRLLNFKNAAQLLYCTPEAALLGFVTKHIASMYDTINRGMTRDKRYWEEKLGDIINYMILLDAIVKERKGSN